MLPRILLGVYFCCVMTCGPLAASEESQPALGAGTMIAVGKEPINIEVGHLVPCVADWDGDGKHDLIVGQFSGGKIRLYLNEGTNLEPVLGEFEYLSAGGKEISLPAG